MKHLFISWSSDSGKIGSTIAEQCKTFIEKIFNNKIRVFASNVDIMNDWSDDLKKALIECEHLIVILTPQAVDSMWMSYEYGVMRRNPKQVFVFGFGKVKKEHTPFSINQVLDFSELHIKQVLFSVLLYVLRTDDSINCDEQCWMNIFNNIMKMSSDFADNINNIAQKIDNSYVRNCEMREAYNTMLQNQQKMKDKIDKQNEELGQIIIYKNKIEQLEDKLKEYESVFGDYEPYALFDGVDKLTFYYTGGKPQNAFSMRSEWRDGWYSLVDQIQIVVFDSSFKFYKPTSCAYWFSSCTRLQKIVGMEENLDTSNITDMRCMFADCEKLESIDVSCFKTNNVVNMRSMFDGCKKLRQINVCGFNTELVTNMKSMFKGCQELEKIYSDAGSWNTSKVECSDEMFEECNKLVGGKYTPYDSSAIDKNRAKIDDGESSPGYFTLKDDSCNE